MIAKNDDVIKQKINAIEITTDTLTGRGGLCLFVRYLTQIRILPIFERLFGYIRKSQKGIAIGNIFKQLFCYFLDGTSLTLSRFDDLKADRGYTEIIENDSVSMCSSHAMKRFYQSFSLARIWLFRKVLLSLFIWRLKVERPEVVILGIDTMVMDNDSAQKREGVEPTYKKVKGFQPLQMTWGRYLIDAIFRERHRNSNYGDHVLRMVRAVVNKIRSKYRKDVPILLKADSGFFDQKNFEGFSELRIGYIAGGKIYEEIKEYVANTSEEYFGEYEKENNSWIYTEFGDKRGSWTEFRRAIYMKPICEEGQVLFEFARPETIVYTNLGVDKEVTELFEEAGKEKYLNTESIIREYHQRGEDELVHKALKDFGTEHLPFERFKANSAFYYTMVIAFFLFEAFKWDVCSGVLSVRSYATTFKRMLIDFAAKIVHTSHRLTVKVTEAVCQRISLENLWHKSNNPPVLSSA